MITVSSHPRPTLMPNVPAFTQAFVETASILIFNTCHNWVHAVGLKQVKPVSCLHPFHVLLLVDAAGKCCTLKCKSKVAGGGAGAGRAAHEAADSVRQEGQQANSAVKQAGEALEDGFVAAVQAPRHLAETVKRQVAFPHCKPPLQTPPLPLPPLFLPSLLCFSRCPCGSGVDAHLS